MNCSFEVERLGVALGAEVRNVDLSQPLDSQAAARLKSALAEHLVLLFREQELSPAGQIAFAACFGIPDVHSFVPGVPGAEHITEIRKEPEHRQNFGGTWHFDSSFLPTPPAAAVLLAKQVPATGGDTLWSNQYLAYSSLPVGRREELSRLRALHSSQLAFGGFANNDKVLSAEHPLVPLHPWTGRRHLFANPVSTDRLVGKTPEESAELLGFLFAHAVQDEFFYRHRWQAGDLVVWDNRATMHMAMNDYGGQRRVMHRVSVREAAGVRSAA